VTNEDDAPATADDPRNYDFAEADVQMSSPESTIAADARNYDLELEPAPPVVPPEQQASSSRTTLDDPPPAAARFLGFRFRPIEEVTPDSRHSFVEEIVQQAVEAEGDVEQVENALRFMSEVFDDAGRLLSKQRRGGKGKGKERAQ
jgi:hypothetical protein